MPGLCSTQIRRKALRGNRMWGPEENATKQEDGFSMMPWSVQPWGTYTWKESSREVSQNSGNQRTELMGPGEVAGDRIAQREVT